MYVANNIPTTPTAVVTTLLMIVAIVAIPTVATSGGGGGDSVVEMGIGLTGNHNNINITQTIKSYSNADCHEHGESTTITTTSSKNESGGVDDVILMHYWKYW